MKKLVRVLVIPGWGDIHWCFLKLEGLLAKLGNPPCEVVIWNFDGRPRSIDFVGKVPFVKPGGYWRGIDHTEFPLFKKTYMDGGLDIVENFHGFDFLLCFNGTLRVGKPFSEILPEIPINWRYPITENDAERQFSAEYKSKYGKFALLAFSDYGMFEKWVQAFPLSHIREYLRVIRERHPDLTFLLTGSAWDCRFNNQIGEDSKLVNLCGKTSTDQFFALMRAAEIFVGVSGGNTILSQHFGTPTVILWSEKQFPHSGFFTNWVEPVKIGRCYYPVVVEGLSSARLVSETERALEKGRFPVELSPAVTVL